MSDISLIGPRGTVHIFGIRLVGFNAENGVKLLLTLVLVLIFWLLSRVPRSVARSATRGCRDARSMFWSNQAINILVTVLFLIGFVSIWFDDPTRLTTALGLVTGGPAFALQFLLPTMGPTGRVAPTLIRRCNMTSQEFERQKQKDLAVLDLLEKHHSDTSRPYLIEHHFITDSKTGGLELREWAGLNGFAVSPLQRGEWEGRCYYHFDLSRPTIPTIENISPQTSLMLRLAAEFECTYDGWGCTPVVE